MLRMVALLRVLLIEWLQLGTGGTNCTAHRFLFLSCSFHVLNHISPDRQGDTKGSKCRLRKSKTGREKKAKEVVADVPFSRLMALNRPELMYGASQL